MGDGGWGFGQLGQDLNFSRILYILIKQMLDIVPLNPFANELPAL